MKIYCNHPFNTSAQVRVINPCGPKHKGAKDVNFVGMQLGEPVYAMESGHVAEIRRGLPPSSNPDDLPNNVVIRGADQFYTEYAHITPVARVRPKYTNIPAERMWWNNLHKPLLKGTFIRQGDLIGHVDNSGHIIGDLHVHINRYDPGPEYSLHDRPSACDWFIKGVDAGYIPPGVCAIQSGHHFNYDHIPHRMNYYQMPFDRFNARRKYF